MTPNEMLDLTGALDESIGWLENAGCRIGEALENMPEGTWVEMEEAGKLADQAFALLKKAQELLAPLEKHAREDLDYIEALADAASY